MAQQQQPQQQPLHNPPTPLEVLERRAYRLSQQLANGDGSKSTAHDFHALVWAINILRALPAQLLEEAQP